VDELVHGVGLVDRETAGLGTAEFGEVGAAAGDAAELMGNGADVGTGGADDAEASLVIVAGKQVEGLDGDLDRFQVNGQILAGELVSGHAVDLLGGNGRRHLRMGADLEVKPVAELSGIERDRRGVAGSLALSVVSVSGEAKANDGLVDFATDGDELREAGGFADDQGQDAGGHGVQGAKVADFGGARKAPHLVHRVVRCPAGWLIQDDDPVEFHSS